MRESRTSGSVRGDRGNSVPYRHRHNGVVAATRQKHRCRSERLWGDHAAAHHGDSNEANADAEEGKGRRLRDRAGQETMAGTRAVDKIPDDLTRIVNAESSRT